MARTWALKEDSVNTSIIHWCSTLVASFDEAPLIVESYLHSLFDNLTDRDQVFGDSGDMQYIFEVSLMAIVSEWDVPDMLYWMSHVIPCLDISGSLGCV